MMVAATLNEYPKTNLTLSAAPELLPEDAEAAAWIESELDFIDSLTEQGLALTARIRLARLFDYVMGGDAL